MRSVQGLNSRLSVVIVLDWIALGMCCVPFPSKWTCAFLRVAISADCIHLHTMKVIDVHAFTFEPLEQTFRFELAVSRRQHVCIIRIYFLCVCLLCVYPSITWPPYAGPYKEKRLMIGNLSCLYYMRPVASGNNFVTHGPNCCITLCLANLL